MLSKSSFLLTPNSFQLKKCLIKFTWTFLFGPNFSEYFHHTIILPSCCGHLKNILIFDLSQKGNSQVNFMRHFLSWKEIEVRKKVLFGSKILVWPGSTMLSHKIIKKGVQKIPFKIFLKMHFPKFPKSFLKTLYFFL